MRNFPYQIPSDHALRRTFRELTRRGARCSSLSDSELHWYLTHLLLEFVRSDSFFGSGTQRLEPVGYLTQALEDLEYLTGSERRDLCRHMGDHSLFVLGFFPGSLKGSLSRQTYAELGRRFYLLTSEVEDSDRAGTFRKLFEHFPECVKTLNWVRDYTHDQFYQYMFRQFDVA